MVVYLLKAPADCIRRGFLCVTSEKNKKSNVLPYPYSSKSFEKDYGGDVLPVGIKYDTEKKTHESRIERLDSECTM